MNLSIFSSDENTLLNSLEMNSLKVKIDLKTLGNTDISKVKYSFNIETPTVKSFTPKILGFEDSNSFKLEPLNTDPSLMRVKLSYDIFSMISDEVHTEVAPKSTFVELYLNNNYQGVYNLEERVNKRLLKLPDYKKNDTTHSVIYEAEGEGADLTNGVKGFSQKEPDPDTEAVYLDPLANLASFVQSSSKNDFDSKVSSYLNIENAIDYEILYLVSGNQDTLSLNQYLYQSNAANADKRFNFCPGDNYISSFGIDIYSDRLASAKGIILSPLYNKLSESSSYMESLKEKYNNLRKDILTPVKIDSLIDLNYKTLKSAWERNFEAFPAPGKTSFEDEVSYMKSFIQSRISYLDGHLNNPPSITIGGTTAKIYDQADTVFCALPAGSNTMQAINYDFGPGAKVYIEDKPHGAENILNNDFYYNDFTKYENLISNKNRTGQIQIYLDDPKSGTVIKHQILGWAVNHEIKNSPGIDAIFVFDGPAISKKSFLGKAQIDLPRPDVGAYLGNTFYENSGFRIGINTSDLANGSHNFYIYAFGKNGKYSEYILPVIISDRIQITNGQKFDFKDFIFNGNLIVEDGQASSKYDLWVTTGNLPVVQVTTNTPDLNIQSKIDGKVRIIDNSGYFDGNVAIRERGWLSNIFPKKQYSIEIRDEYGNQKNISMLGMPAGNDWILGSSYIDKTLIRDAIAFKLGSEMGYYESKNKFVELFLGEDSDDSYYWGVYILKENIRVDKNRVNITKIKSTDENNPADVETGMGADNGYMLAISNNPKNRSSALLMVTGLGTVLRIEYPKKTEINESQVKWISDYVKGFENILYGDNFKDPTQGYSKYVDVNSLVDYVIINELFKNRDSFKYNTMITKDVNGKLEFGPLWDFELSAGNISTDLLANGPTGWMYLNRQWAERFFMDDDFLKKLSTRWKELRKDILSDSNIENLITSYTNELSDSQIRNFKQWPVLGQEIRYETQPIPTTYNEEISRLRAWLTERVGWIDDNVDLDYSKWIENNYDSEWFEKIFISLALTTEQQKSLNNTVNQQINLYGIENISFAEAINDNYLNPGIGQIQSEWVGGIKSGKIYGILLAYRFIKNDVLNAYLKSLNNNDYIEFLYKVILNRKPNFHDLNDMLNCLNYTQSREEMLKYFLSSWEFNMLCNKLNMRSI